MSSIINSDMHGAAAVEMIYLLLIFLAFLAVVQRFSFLAVDAHRIDARLQRDVEIMMTEGGRPACLEGFGSNKVEFTSSKKIFGDSPIRKRLVFATGPICSEE